MEIGDRTQVTLGTRRVEVTVTQQNQQMLKDGDLTNDLNRIAAGDGDAASVKAGDFAAAGFDPADRNLLTRMSQGIARVDLSDATLGSHAGNFKAIVASKPYLQANGATPTLPQLQGMIQNMPVSGRNGVLSELATETAMLQVRGQAMGAMGQAMMSRMTTITGTNDPVRAVTQQLNAMPGGNTAANRDALAGAILAWPDMPLATKHATLQAIGMTKLEDRNTAINNARTEALAKVETAAQQLYTQLGGLGTMGETHSMATGDGTGTQGLAGKPNQGIAYMSYADATSTNGPRVAGANSNTLTFNPSDVTQPVPIHLSATGADQAGNQVSITRGNQTIRFQANVSGDNTVLALAPNQTLPQGVTYNARTQTLTFPPGADEIKVTQSSAGNSSNYDEVQVNVTAFNASTGQPSLAIDFGKLFGPDRFNIDWNALPPEQQQQVVNYAKHLAANPDESLTLNLQGKGPTDFDGSAMKEISGYGAEASGTSKAEFADLRSSVLDVDADRGTGTVTATTDPVRSSLLSAGANAPLTPAGRQAMQKFMGGHTNLTPNDVLAGLRAHAITQLLQQVTVAYGGKASQVSVGTSTVDQNTTFTTANFQAIAAGQQVLQNLPAKP
jgi:hypothetical protein